MKHPIRDVPASSVTSELPHPVRRVVRSPGRSLDTSNREQMEARFGTDLSHVRIHTDSQAANSAIAVNAEAYTVGDHIAFANSSFGSELLAHELTHVLQQTKRDGPLLSDSQAENTARAYGRSLPTHHSAPGHVGSLMLQKQDAGEKKPAKKKAVKAQTPASTVLAQYTKWIDERIQNRQTRIEKLKRRYKKNKLKVTDKDLKPHKRLKTRIKTALSSADAHGQGALTLANVVVNEAGTSNQSAKTAVAHAYMNRVGGVVREPVGAEISSYETLGDRWSDFDDGDRLLFLDQFADSVDAAVGRLSDQSPSKNDPTKGATHWVSPQHLPKYIAKKYKKTRYKRTVGTAADKAFPKWARSDTDAEVKKMQKAGQLGKNFKKLTVPGVTEEEFLFYKDVNY